MNRAKAERVRNWPTQAKVEANVISQLTKGFHAIEKNQEAKAKGTTTPLVPPLLATNNSVEITPTIVDLFQYQAS